MLGLSDGSSYWKELGIFLELLSKEITNDILLPLIRTALQEAMLMKGCYSSVQRKRKHPRIVSKIMFISGALIFWVVI